MSTVPFLILCLTGKSNIVAFSLFATSHSYETIVVHYTSQHMAHFVVLSLESARDQLQPPSRTWQELHGRTPDPSRTWQELQKRSPELTKHSRCHSCIVACFSLEANYSSTNHPMFLEEGSYPILIINSTCQHDCIINEKPSPFYICNREKDQSQMWIGRLGALWG